MFSLLGRTALLLTLAVALGAGVNALRKDRLQVGRWSMVSTCGVGGPTAAAGLTAPVALVDAQQATRLCGDAGVMLADVRPADRFAAGHVAEAVHLPCAASATASSGPLSLLGSKHTVVVYGDSSEEARPVAEALRARVGAGGKVLVLAGGFAAWEQAGLACTSGPCPDCQRRAQAGR